MGPVDLSHIVSGICSGEIIPYLGPEALAGVVHSETGEPIPADSESLILAMNGGKPMAPKLMYEFPRAAMNLELKKGRSFVNRFLEQTYSHGCWSLSPLHQALADARIPYIVDVNRDTQLQDLYADRPHVLVVGIARIGGTDYRFKVFRCVEGEYIEIDQAEVSDNEAILFKPMGTPDPSPIFIASDADYVDYITELMGGFAVPDFIKERRLGKRYVSLGLRYTRDTERMVFSDLIYGAAANPAGWAIIEEPTPKERRFCASKRMEILESSLDAVLRDMSKNITASS